MMRSSEKFFFSFNTDGPKRIVLLNMAEEGKIVTI